MRNEEYGKDYRSRKFRMFKRIIMWFFILMILGLVIGSTMGSSNPFLIFWPPAWSHFFGFLH